MNIQPRFNVMTNQREWVDEADIWLVGDGLMHSAVWGFYEQTWRQVNKDDLA